MTDGGVDGCGVGLPFSRSGCAYPLPNLTVLPSTPSQGKCMSMHQPWASLLVYGIKMHEGRTWYSPHRGRLWIAAAAKVWTKEGGDGLFLCSCPFSS
jgi:hypothetical protein